MDNKWVLRSLTIWGGIVVFLVNVLPVLGPMVGFDISPDEVQEAGNAVSDVIKSVGTVVGLAMVFIGRARKGDLTALPHPNG